MIQQSPIASQTPTVSRKNPSFLATYTTREQLLKDIETEQRAFATTVASSKIQETASQSQLLEAYLDYWKSLTLIQEVIHKFHSSDHKNSPTPVLDALRNETDNESISDEQLQQASEDTSLIMQEVHNALESFQRAITRYSKLKTQSSAG